MKNILIYSLCLISLAACSPQEPADPQARPDKIAAPSENTVIQVGPAEITRKQVEERLNQLDKADRSFATSQAGSRNFLQLLAREQLAVLDAQDKKLDKSENYIADLKAKRKQLDEIYQAYADQLLLRLWEEDNRANGLITVSEEEIAAYHKKYPYEMKVKQIIVTDPQTAETLWRELKHNKSRWKELERRYSVAPERSRGKEITIMPGEFIPELEVIAANSPIGSVQGFVKTSQGFHIIMKTGERRLALKDASERIRTILENQKQDALLDALQNKYEVVIYEQNN